MTERRSLLSTRYSANGGATAGPLPRLQAGLALDQVATAARFDALLVP
jgi:hypothetical protein